MYSLFFAAGPILISLGSLVYADKPTIANYSAYQDGVYGIEPSQTFMSSPIVGPLIQVNSWNKSAVDNAPYIFVAANYGGNSVPMIVSAKDLNLVYASPTQYSSAFDARVQAYNGQNYLTFWEGVQTGGFGQGNCLLFDETYTLRYNISSTVPGAEVDVHECKLTPSGAALITVYKAIGGFNLTAVGGPANGTIEDCFFQEIDIATGQALFTWQASAHFPFTDSFQGYDTVWDFFHMNSVEKTPDGDYLISSRHTSTVSLISGTNGSVIWILGGKRNMFRDLSGGNATNIGWQHDARYLGTDLSQLTLFDDHTVNTAVNCTANCSRGLHLEMDYRAMTAKVVQEYWHPESVQSGAMGGYQTLNDTGNVLVGWGTNPAITEHKSDGTAVMDIQFGPLGVTNSSTFLMYRAFKMDWKGAPTWNPSIAATGNTSSATIYLSWNGATELKYWALLASNTSDSLDGPSKVISNVTRAGFETAVNVTGVARYLRAAALDSVGAILGSSPAVDLLTGQTLNLNSSVTSVVMPPEDPEANATSTSAAPSTSPTASPTSASSETSPSTPSPSSNAVNRLLPVSCLELGVWGILSGVIFSFL